MEISSHIKVGNLYRFVNQWSVSSDNTNSMKLKIPINSIVLLLEVSRLRDNKDACKVKFLFDGKIVWRDIINTTSVNKLESVF